MVLNIYKYYILIEKKRIKIVVNAIDVKEASVLISKKLVTQYGYDENTNVNENHIEIVEGGEE